MSSLMRYILLQQEELLEFVEMPSSYAYQLSALNRRLHKELDKLTAAELPQVPFVIADCSELELIDTNYQIISGLDYIKELEQTFQAIHETSYPMKSLLTEIRALLVQLEQWYEEDYTTEN